MRSGTGACTSKQRCDAAARNADLYQMLAYMVAGGLSTGMLIYAREPDEPRGPGSLGSHYAVRRLDRTIEVVSLDASGSPDQLLGAVGSIAHRIGEMSELHVLRSSA